ncbi:MAG: prephenate dehydrogenase [Chloroflexi bacterium]|nr:prephenate dehydrogenase [Chloroflexota bacterium]
MDRITIIGFGAYGASIGLGLKKAKLSNTEIIGTSRERSVLASASKMGAVDKTMNNLGSAVTGANLVIMDTPITETRELLEAIGPLVSDGCVITDIGASKVIVMQWAKELLPKGVNYVGGHPLLKNPTFDIEESTPTLFEDIEYCIISGDTVDKGSLKTIVNLVETLGAKPLFMDPHEHDSYATAMSFLPMIVSSAFVNIAARSDGWREMHRLAASEYSEFSRLATTDPQDIEAACLANPDELVYWIDQMIAELYDYRTQIVNKDDKLLDTFVTSWEARARWEANVVIEDNRIKLPGAAESMAAAFFGERLANRYKELTDPNAKKKSPWQYFKRNR